MRAHGLGAALKHHRLLSKYTQDDVAAALHVSRTMVAYWEADSRRPSTAQIRAMGYLYGVDRDLMSLALTGAVLTDGAES